MNSQELIERFRVKANLDTSIGTFAFDDLPAVNQNRNKAYPLILLKTPQSVITPFMDGENEPQWEDYTLTFYALFKWKKGDKSTKPLEQAYKEIEAVGDGFLRTVLQSGLPDFSLIGDKQVTKQRGHHQHVDQLVGCSYTFTLRVHSSFCN